MRSHLPSGTPVEIARPADGRDPARGLVLIPDIGGLRPLFDGHAQRIADERGWAVAVVEPWPGREHLELAERLELVGSVDQQRLLDDAFAAADALAVSPVGITGFCMGGMFALLAADTGRFHRAVSFYGMIRIPDQWRAEGQREPLNAATSDRACPTLAIIGTVDPWTPAPDVEALATGGVQVVTYDGADHGFVHAPDRPTHRPDDAADAWRRALDFLAG
jgi:carboxymethylenebutenolidase